MGGGGGGWSIKGSGGNGSTCDVEVVNFVAPGTISYSE